MGLFSAGTKKSRGMLGLPSTAKDQANQQALDTLLRLGSRDAAPSYTPNGKSRTGVAALQQPGGRVTYLRA